MIYVTKPYLPSINKYKSYIDKIYESNYLTNNGPLIQELEERLQEYLGVKNLLLVSNGTLALQVAYKLLNLKGEVITTPFSFVATSSSLTWEGITPILADIDPKTFNIDPLLMVEKITQKTTALLPVHVFGNSCEVEKIQGIADKYNLKVIYDAAHAFGVKYKDQSIFNYGDISTVSFHATKLFHTIEGGALIIKDDEIYERAKRIINFGYSNGEIKGLGINTKMNEFQAAMGLSLLDEMDMVNKNREVTWKIYKENLQDDFVLQKLHSDATYNYHYFPIILKDEQQTLKIEKALNEKQIFPRRYFHPSLDTLDYIKPKQRCDISRDISSRVLCFPIYPTLHETEQKEIIKIIKENV